MLPQMRDLRSLRLGRRERQLLLHVAGARRRRGQVQSVALPPLETNAAQSAQRRAAAKLVKAGLIKVVEERRVEREGRRYWRVRYAIPTPLGRAVATACRRQLEEGRAIRWERMLPAIRAELAR